MTRKIRWWAVFLTTTVVAAAAGAACFEGLTAPLPASRAVPVGFPAGTPRTDSSGDRARPNWPRVSGSRIVWQDSRYSHPSDIYEYNLQTGEEKRVTFDWYDQEFPSVSDRWLVGWDLGRHPQIMALRLPVGPTP